MARKYRKRKGQHDEWHFCTNCSNWPTSNYIERTTRPTTGELCNQCRSKERRGVCTPKY